MSQFQSDALVFFGATGDLAYKKIFPALQAMVKRGHSTYRSSAWPNRAGHLRSCERDPATAWNITVELTLRSSTRKA
jgi:hypothetical protein